MKVKTITLTFLVFIKLGFSQNTTEVRQFSEALKLNIETYNLAVSQIDFKHNPKESEAIFNDFVNNTITNTYFDNFKAKNLNGALISINDYFKKPLILTSYATWFIVEDHSVAELNQLAKTHHRLIDFAVVFWETVKTTRKKAKLFNRHIKILYIDERENTFSNEIYHMKYPLGQSLIYYIDNENLIVDLKKNNYYVPDSNETYNTKFVKNRNQFTKGVSLLLIDKDFSKNNVALE